MTAPEGVTLVKARSHDDALALDLLRGEYASASDHLDALRGQASSSAQLKWSEYVVLANLGGAGTAAALSRLVAPEPLITFDTFTSALPPQIDARWHHEGGGPAHVAGSMLRLVSLGDVSSAFEAEVAELDNAVGTWVEAAVKRGPGGADNCRLEVADGSAREVLVINPGSLTLLSTGATVQFPAASEHLYGLWISGQTSRLYVDGQPILESRGLPASSARTLRFGTFAAGADSESYWRLVNVSSGVRRAIPLELPPVWPSGWWVTAIDAAGANGEVASVAAYLQQASLTHPDSIEIRDRLRAFLMGDSAAELTPAVVRALIPLLPPTDRAAIAGHTAFALRGEPLLVANDLGVRFRTGAKADRSIRQTAVGLLRRGAARSDEYFWANRHVTVEVRSGDLIAIIGRNGAGKTTLLNALADLIEPDEGEVRAFGRPMLLTQGSGFLPGLTGRDNVLLSGLYLGLTRREITARFEEIVEFAELWDAIDRPVRTYSAGMKSRLQFAIATTVDPELLLLDELLGAGDAAFTEKAQTRMHQQLRRSKAVVIATHDLHFVRTQCTAAVVLEAGQVLFQGAAEAAAIAYQDLLIARPKRTDRVTS